MAVRPPWENERYIEIEKNNAVIEEDVNTNEHSAAEPHLPSDKANKSPINNADLLVIAKRQKTLLGVLLLSILTFILLIIFIKPSQEQLNIFASIFALSIIWFTARLCLKIYALPKAIVMIILSFIPVVSLLVLLIANVKSTRLLRSKGFRVGLMGANI